MKRRRRSYPHTLHCNHETTCCSYHIFPDFCDFPQAASSAHHDSDAFHPDEEENLGWCQPRMNRVQVSGKSTVRARIGRATHLPRPPRIGRGTHLPRPPRIGRATHLPRPPRIGRATHLPQPPRIGRATHLPRPPRIGSAAHLPRPLRIGR
ncbi:hypothetical protein STEG23_033438, partial [Scotinomys teguina]